MKNFLYTVLLSLNVASCAPGGEQSHKIEDLENFIA